MRRVRINTLDGYENVLPCYYVSDTGEILTDRSGTIEVMKGAVNKGYRRVALHTVRDGAGNIVGSGRKNVPIHRAVGLAFVEGRTEQLNVCNHLDENTLNNSYLNISWLNILGNSQFGLGSVRSQVTRSSPVIATKVVSYPSSSQSALVAPVMEGVFYRSKKEANDHGFYTSGINRSCRTGEPYKGFVWSMVDRLPPAPRRQSGGGTSKIGLNGGTGRFKRKVIVLHQDDLRTILRAYTSVREASIGEGVGYDLVRNICVLNRFSPTDSGLMYCYEDSHDEWIGLVEGHKLR